MPSISVADDDLAALMRDRGVACARGWPVDLQRVAKGVLSRCSARMVFLFGKRQADLCLGIIRKLMNWYASRNDDYLSPVVRGMNRYRPAERKRSRILNDDEIRALWTVTEDMGTFGALVRLLLLTGRSVGIAGR